jgi:hypothetical protein
MDLVKPSRPFIKAKERCGKTTWEKCGNLVAPPMFGKPQLDLNMP